MDAKTQNEPFLAHSGLTVERISPREIAITRTINGPARLVFEAFRNPELFQRWWVPKSCGFTLLSCEMDVRVGGKYRLVFPHGDSTMAFFGTYIEVTPPSRLAWTNEEAGEGGAITTVTLQETAGKTVLVLQELHASKEALDTALASGAYEGMSETFDQLAELVGTLGEASAS